MTMTQASARRRTATAPGASGRSRRLRLHPFLVPVVLVVATPLVILNEYYLGIASLALVYVVIGSAFNLLYGYLGLLSFAQVAFLGIGGYVSGWLAVNTGTSLPLVLLAGGVGGATAAAVLGAVTVRLSEGAFAIITLSFTLLCAVVAAGWTGVTGGRQGMFGLPAPGVAVGSTELAADTERSYFVLLGGFALISLYAMWKLVTSRWGRVMVAIRDNEPLARAQGYRTNLRKLTTFVIAGGITGLAGSLHVFRLTTIDPSIFDFYLMQAMLIIVVLGGAGTFWPVVVSAVTFALLPEMLRSAEEWRLVIYGCLLVVGLLVIPQGIGGYLAERAVRRRVQRAEVAG